MKRYIQFPTRAIKANYILKQGRIQDFCKKGADSDSGHGTQLLQKGGCRPLVSPKSAPALKKAILENCEFTSIISWINETVLASKSQGVLKFACLQNDVK